MKKVVGLLVFSIMILALNPLDLLSLPQVIYVYGKGGVIIENGKVRICPITSPDVCAVVDPKTPIPGDPGRPSFVGLRVDLCYQTTKFHDLTIAEQPEYIKTETGYQFFGVWLYTDEQTAQTLQSMGEPTEPNCQE